MLIWDYIRDFLVQNIFGGFDSNGNAFSCYVGRNIEGDMITTTTLQAHTNFGDGLGGYDYFDFTLGDWLSTTTTIIIMCLIVVLFAMLVRWVFKTVVSAFLLR